MVENQSYNRVKLNGEMADLKRKKKKKTMHDDDGVGMDIDVKTGRNERRDGKQSDLMQKELKLKNKIYSEHAASNSDFRSVDDNASRYSKEDYGHHDRNPSRN